MEPNAPPPQKRIDALERLKDAGIPVILRFDPVIPFVNDGVIDDVIESCSFVDHVVTSTLKLRHDSFRRIIKVFPELGNKYKKLYFEEGDRIQNSWYLPAEMRKSILEKVAEKCKEFGISCAFCREGFEFNAKSCDGSHLIRD
jgi:DNA repair photolyase